MRRDGKVNESDKAERTAVRLTVWKTENKLIILHIINSDMHY